MRRYFRRLMYDYLKRVHRNHATAHNGTTAPLCRCAVAWFLIGRNQSSNDTTTQVSKRINEIWTQVSACSLEFASGQACQSI